MAVEFEVNGLENLPGHVLEFAMVLAESGRLSSRTTVKDTTSDPYDLVKNPTIDAIRARAQARAAAKREDGYGGEDELLQADEIGKIEAQHAILATQVNKKNVHNVAGDGFEASKEYIEPNPELNTILELSKKQHATEFTRAMIIVGLASVRSSFSMSTPPTIAVMASMATGIGLEKDAAGDGSMEGPGLSSLTAQTRALLMTLAMTSSKSAAAVYPRTSATPAEFLSASARHLTPVSGVSASTATGAGTSAIDKRTVIIQAAFGGVNLHRLPSLSEGYKDKEVYLRPARDDGGSGERIERETARWRKRGAAEIVIEVDGEGIETSTLIAILATSGVLKKFNDVEAGRHPSPPATGTIRVSEWVSGRGGIMVSLAGDSIDRKPARPLMKARRII
jgi:hypothetical protein